MTRITNLPSVDEREKIVCETIESGYRFKNADGWTICDVQGVSKGSLGQQLARVLQEVYLQGFERGREHVREALGIKR